MGAVTEVRGMAGALQAAAEGMKLFESEQAGAVELDVAGAEKYKAEVDEKIAALEAEAAKLTGKDNKKERAAKGKEVSELKGEARYVDACKVAKGMEPKNGNFAKFPEPVKKAAPAAPEPEPEAKAEPKKKDEKKAKKQESAGISPAETKELEQLKKDIVERKEQLKAEGLSGGQQNKDAQIVAWVARLNELKEKQEPGSTQKDKKKEVKKGSRAPLSSQEQIEMDKLKGEIEEYKHRLRTEFGYGPKDMKADPDLKDMEAKLAAFEKRS